MKWIAVVATIAALALGGCGGGDAECGNGEREEGEACDDGNDVNDDNCTNSCQLNLPDTLDATVKWAFNKNSAPLFDQDSCFDMGVTQVDVEIRHTSNSEAVFQQSETCGFKQVTFLDIPAGDYLARVSPLNIDGELKTNDVIEQLFTISTQDVEVTVNIPFDQWKDSYTGTFFFRLHWGGMGVDCSTAGPPVAKHRLRLERDGTTVDQLTDVGDRLDGTMPGDCRTLGEQFPQSVLELPWGPYVFTVQGLDDGGEAQFETSFDTFVGAGVSNPEMDFIVNSLAPDAGVPDGGMPDAGVPDAAL